MKIRNVSLVRPSNEGYRAHQGRHAQASMHLRDTLDPGPVQKLSGPVENLLQQWLAARLRMTPRRILRYERLTRENRYKTYYKEIDAIEMAAAGDASPEEAPTRPRRLFEFKCSSNAGGALSSAGAQLDRAMDALSSRWDRQIYRHAILVAVVPDVMELEEEPTPLEAFEPAVPERQSPDAPLTTCLTAEDLWRWGTERGVLEANPDLLAEAQADARATASRRQRRQQLKEEGVPREEWPDELISEPRDTPETQTATFVDEAAEEDESPLARAMREAMEGDE